MSLLVGNIGCMCGGSSSTTSTTIPKVEGGRIEVIKTAAFNGFVITIPGPGIVIENTVMVHQMGGSTLLYGDDYTYNPTTKEVTINIADDPNNYANGELIFQTTYLYTI